MTLSPGSETDSRPPSPPPAAESKSPRRRREPPPIFAGSAAPAEPSSGPQDGSSLPPAEAPSASESSGAGDGKKRRRGRGERSATPSIADRRQIKAALAAGVGLVGVQLHEAAAAREPLAEDEALWLTDEQDREGIAEPLSSIIGRRGGPGVMDPDLGDAIAALIAFAVYVSKNLGKRAKIRAFRRSQADPETPPADAAAETVPAA